MTKLQFIRIKHNLFSSAYERVI